MGHVVRVYKQALFRNHRLLSCIPPFTVEAQLCESILGSISAKHPRFRPFVARVCPSTPHSVTSNQGVQVLQWIRMDCLCERDKHGLWSSTCSAYFGGARPDWVASFYWWRIPEQHIWIVSTLVWNIYRSNKTARYNSEHSNTCFSALAQTGLKP